MKRFSSAVTFRNSDATQLQGAIMSLAEILHQLDGMLTGVLGQSIPPDKPLMQVTKKLRGYDAETKHYFQKHDHMG